MENVRYLFNLFWSSGRVEAENPWSNSQEQGTTDRVGQPQFLADLEEKPVTRITRRLIEDFCRRAAPDGAAADTAGQLTAR